jgi:UDPglucose--hexose-1-phosphate uridylyltransferase
MEFKSVIKNAVFYDPFNNFQKTERPTDIRIDPLTGRSSRIIYFPVTLPPPPDQSQLAEVTRQYCPFCKPAVFERTPRFTEDIVPEGRFTRGSAVVFPNAFPYDAHSAVTVVTEGHYVKMDAFDVRELEDALLVGREYLRRINALQPQCAYLSINMNYMPTAGGSILHPHMQLIAGDIPTTYQREHAKLFLEYRKTHGTDYFSDLIDQEQQRRERFIARTGNIAWLCSFAPLGITEFLAVFEDGLPIVETEEPVVGTFALGMATVLRYLASMNFASFNMALFSAPTDNRAFPTHARIVPRTLLPPVGASDVNYFELLHHEVLTIIKPEESAKGAAVLFEGAFGRQT